MRSKEFIEFFRRERLGQEKVNDVRTHLAFDHPEFDIGHRTLRATFDHMTTTTQGWTIEMGGQPGGSPPSGDSSLAALKTRFNGAHDAFARYVRQLRDADQLEETFVDDFGANITQIGAALHVLLHNVEHRSELLHLLVRLGLTEVPEIDLALWEIERLETVQQKTGQ